MSKLPQAEVEVLDEFVEPETEHADVPPAPEVSATYQLAGDLQGAWLPDRAVRRDARNDGTPR